MTIFILFYLGSCLASFAYCFAADWVNQRISFWRRSQCDHCHQSLKWTDLIPLVSQLIHRSTCPYCQQSYSYSYIIVELLGGFIFVASYLIFNQMSLIFISLFSLVVMLMIFADWIGLWVPDLLQLSLIILTSFYIMTYSENLINLWNVLLILFIFISIQLLRHQSIGGADIKTLAILSVFLPIDSLAALLFIASLSALVFAYLRKQSNKAIPFIPFIYFAFYFLMLF